MNTTNHPEFTVSDSFAYSTVYSRSLQTKKILQFHPYDRKTQKYMSENGYKAVFEVFAFNEIQK